MLKYLFNWIKRVGVLYFSSLVLIFCIVSLCINIYTFNKIDNLLRKQYIYQEKVLTIEEKLERLEESFVRYKKMTEWSHRVNWYKFFRHIKYRLNGNIRYNELDCSGGVWYNATKIGGNPDNNSSESTYQQMKKLKCQRRWKARHVKAGDLIFFYRNGVIAHVGLVIARVGKWKTIIRYLDINSISNGPSQKETRFNNSKRIYSPNFKWWVGKKLRKHLKNYKRRYPEYI
jgi:hypothetical protein